MRPFTVFFAAAAEEVLESNRVARAESFLDLVNN